MCLTRPIDSAYEISNTSKYHRKPQAARGEHFELAFSVHHACKAELESTMHNRAKVV